MKKYVLLIFIFSFIPFTQGCEGENVFSGFHKAGTDTATQSRLADARRALRDGKYKEALKIYEEILKRDPNNSEALYGKAAAELRSAGLDLRHIFSTLLDIDEDDDGDIDIIDELFGGLGLKNIASATDSAVKDLKKIADGKADGTIPPDNYDVNMNLSVLITLNAFVEMMVEYDVNDMDELEDILKNPLNHEDIDEIIGKIKDAKKYAEVSGGQMGDDMVETFEELIEDLKKWKNP